MSSENIEVPNESLRPYMATLLDTIVQNSTGDEHKPSAHKRQKIHRAPTVGFILFQDGHCTNFRTKNCLPFSSNHQALKTVVACVPFAHFPSTLQEPLDVELFFEESGPRVHAKKIEQIQTNDEKLRGYLQNILLKVSPALTSLEFETPHTQYVFSFRLNKDGQFIKPVQLTSDGHSSERVGLSALHGINAASPFELLPEQCYSLSVSVCAYQAHTTVSGYVLEVHKT
ncbi:MAG TPA: hypothetical protein V6C76_12115 [Drouetiella sp.]